MIHASGIAQVITNDEPTNKPGDFAIVRIKVGLIASNARIQTVAGWELVGSNFVVKTRATDDHDHVNLVYRFAGSP